jgi:hypothetical protein
MKIHAAIGLVALIASGLPTAAWGQQTPVTPPFSPAPPPVGGYTPATLGSVAQQQACNAGAPSLSSGCRAPPPPPSSASQMDRTTSCLRNTSCDPQWQNKTLCITADGAPGVIDNLICRPTSR